ncbi:FeoA family protein [Sporomusa acidovorans]|uniref:Ferrous iron transporter FeoA-like domain-containing protein n=1 Tax=Sporomusa acidovorans (strain ATCC 49682 / DSM 3132 / Mol) TaxID=1123286 RepID=A0ABZ3J5K7_SPOA4|nr:ferrous iron transport protein A [Sporomusa acidovorans]OZC23960.1 ferrous iron transport protein A [Sporomusa acidovorans DSM 3132]SDF32218.1 ferrous iron transport protein A [Sporomusa acidovorans]
MYSPAKASTLADITVGTACRISTIELAGLLRRRILYLGILPKTQVQCVRKSPAGDPIAFRVRDTTIALRSDDASLIKVDPV